MTTLPTMYLNMELNYHIFVLHAKMEKSPRINIQPSHFTLTMSKTFRLSTLGYCAVEGIVTHSTWHMYTIILVSIDITLKASDK